MAITLGGVTLSDHLVLLGIENAPKVAWSAQRTLGGRQVVQVGPSLTSGRELALQSENHLTQDMVDSVKELEAAGQAVSLVHPRGTYSVVITGVDLEPDTYYVDPDDADLLWYSGTINMIEV